MARYYATFDGSTVAALELNAAGKRRLRIPFTGDPAALKQNMLDTRAALDASIRAQLTSVNNDGTLGVIVPRDAMTRGGTNTAANVYTHPQAVWESDPAVRPTSDILAADATPVAPANPLVIPNSLYDSATAAVTAACNAAGIYSRLGNDPAKSLRSLYPDHPLSYLAWDSFTPEMPGLGGVPLSVSPPRPDQTSTIDVSFSWGKLHPTDFSEAESIWSISIGALEAIGPAGSTGLEDYSTSGVIAPDVESQVAAASSPSGFKAGFRYLVTATVQFRYTATNVYGPLREFTSTFDVVTFTP